MDFFHFWKIKTFPYFIEFIWYINEKITCLSRFKNKLLTMNSIRFNFCLSEYIIFVRLTVLLLWWKFIEIYYLILSLQFKIWVFLLVISKINVVCLYVDNIIFFIHKTHRVHDGRYVTGCIYSCHGICL